MHVMLAVAAMCPVPAASVAATFPAWAVVQDDQRIRELVKQLDSEGVEQRDDASRQLLKLGSAAVPVLKEAMENSASKEVRNRAKEVIAGVVARLISQLGAATIDERKEAARQLFKIGPSAIPALRAAADSDSREARSGARYVIEAIKNGTMQSIGLGARIQKDDKVELEPAFVYETPSECDKSDEGDPSKDPEHQRWYAFQFLGKDGKVLKSYDFLATFGWHVAGEDEWHGENEAHFQRLLPYPEDTESIRVMRNGEVAGEMKRSPNPPTVSISIKPLNGGRFQVEWQLDDKDGDVVEYHISDWPFTIDRYDTRNKKRIELAGCTAGPLVEGYEKNPFRFVLNPTLNPNLSGKQVIEITVSDGLNQARAEASFAIPKK